MARTKTIDGADHDNAVMKGLLEKTSMKLQSREKALDQFEKLDSHKRKYLINILKTHIDTGKKSYTFKDFTKHVEQAKFQEESPSEPQTEEDEKEVLRILGSIQSPAHEDVFRQMKKIHGKEVLKKEVEKYEKMNFEQQDEYILKQKESLKGQSGSKETVSNKDDFEELKRDLDMENWFNKTALAQIKATWNGMSPEDRKTYKKSIITMVRDKEKEEEQFKLEEEQKRLYAEGMQPWQTSEKEKLRKATKERVVEIVDDDEEEEEKNPTKEKGKKSMPRSSSVKVVDTAKCNTKGVCTLKARPATKIVKPSTKKCVVDKLGEDRPIAKRIKSCQTRNKAYSDKKVESEIKTSVANIANLYRYKRMVKASDAKDILIKVLLNAGQQVKDEYRPKVTSTLFLCSEASMKARLDLSKKVRPKNWTQTIWMYAFREFREDCARVKTSPDESIDKIAASMNNLVSSLRLIHIFTCVWNLGGKVEAIDKLDMPKKREKLDTDKLKKLTEETRKAIKAKMDAEFQKSSGATTAASSTPSSGSASAPLKP